MKTIKKYTLMTLSLLALAKPVTAMEAYLPESDWPAYAIIGGSALLLIMYDLDILLAHSNAVETTRQEAVAKLKDALAHMTQRKARTSRLKKAFQTRYADHNPFATGKRAIKPTIGFTKTTEKNGNYYETN